MLKQLSLVLATLCATAAMTIAQNSTVPIGKSSDLLKSLENPPNARLSHKQKISLVIPGGKTLAATVNVNKKSTSNTFIGGIDDAIGGSFQLNFDKKGNLDGYIVLVSEKKAYHYYSNANGDAFVENEDIDKVLCVDYDKGDDHDHKKATHKNANRISTDGSASKLQSLPGAPGVVLLDFDGEYVSNTWWNSGNPINASASGFSSTKIKNIFLYIAEDFAPFNLNITTDEAVFLNAPVNRRMRCIFTPTNTAAPGAGGVAYLRSFRSSTENPCWVFNSGTKGAAEAGSHEIGHTMGLSHDGQSNNTYFNGHGNWGPIMGATYSKNIVQWSKGEYANATQTQDDIAIIAASNNGFGFRNDDHSGSTSSSATSLAISSNGNITTANEGIIARATDVDVFKFNTNGGNVDINIATAPYSNLDLRVRLINSSGSVIISSDPTGTGDATIATNLNSGTYYLRIEGVGEGNRLTNGYTDYGSLGQYFISGTIVSSQSNQSPVANFVTPTPNQQYLDGDPIAVKINASDVDGTIESIELYLNGTFVRTERYDPYVWADAGRNGISVGNHTLTAIVTDNDGAKITISRSFSVIASGPKDCNGDVNGSASIDLCNVCSGGNTGITPNSTCNNDECSSTSAWKSSTVYASAGTEVLYNGIIYRNKWWSQNQIPSAGGPWEVVKYCSANPLGCENIAYWNSSTVYATAGTKVVYQGNLYKNLWWAQGQAPGTNSVWSLLGPCGSSSASALASTNSSIKVYPNPFTSNLTILLPKDLASSEIIVRNAVGRIVMRFQASGNGIEQLSFDSQLAAGIYLLEVISESNHKVIRVEKL